MNKRKRLKNWWSCFTTGKQSWGFCSIWSFMTMLLCANDEFRWSNKLKETCMLMLQGSNWMWWRKLVMWSLLEIREGSTAHWIHQRYCRKTKSKRRRKVSQIKVAKSRRMTLESVLIQRMTLINELKARTARKEKQNKKRCQTNRLWMHSSKQDNQLSPSHVMKACKWEEWTR